MTIWSITNHETGRSKYQPVQIGMSNVHQFNLHYTTLAAKIKQNTSIGPNNAKTFVCQVKVNGKSMYFCPITIKCTLRHVRSMISKHSQDIYRMSSSVLKAVMDVIVRPITEIFQ